MKKPLKQTGKSNLIIDKQFKAKLPGKRETEWGSVYYEHRRNRSDKNPKLKL